MTDINEQISIAAMAIAEAKRGIEDAKRQKIAAAADVDRLAVNKSALPLDDDAIEKHMRAESAAQDKLRLAETKLARAGDMLASAEGVHKNLERTRDYTALVNRCESFCSTARQDYERICKDLVRFVQTYSRLELDVGSMNANGRPTGAAEILPPSVIICGRGGPRDLHRAITLPTLTSGLNIFHGTVLDLLDLDIGDSVAA